MKCRGITCLQCEGLGGFEKTRESEAAAGEGVLGRQAPGGCGPGARALGPLVWSVP